MKARADLLAVWVALAALLLGPFVRFFRGGRLLDEIRAAGFEIEHHWRPGPKKSIFIVARKPG